MNHERVHALLSKASEAIVSEDGRVEHRINNFETIIGNEAEDPFFVPSGAVNDTYGNLNNYVTVAGKRIAKVTLLRYVMLATVIIVVLLFLWSLLSVFSSSTQSLMQDAAGDVANTDQSGTSELHLERIANLIIRDGDWTETRIKLFLREWNKVSPETKDMFKSKAWYQHFTYRLNSKFQQEQEMGVFANQDNAANANLIMKLALALGIADPDINYAASGNDKQQIDALAQEVAQELARLEQAKLAEQQTTSSAEAKESQPSLDSLLKEKLGIANAESTMENQLASKVPAAARNQTAIAAPAPSITDADITRVIEKYTSAYELGDMQQMTSLFGVKDLQQGQQIIAQLKNNYELVFANSQKRDVHFTGINWRIAGNKAVIDSDYEANIELKNNKGVQSVVARARLELRVKNDGLKIDRLELLNRKVNVVTPELNLVSTSKSKTPRAPTAAELQDVVTRLIGAYESGDITMLTSLFASDAKTNDRNGLKGITEDYTQLFANTSERQMFIQGMDWSQDRNYAKGSGDLEAIVFAGSGESVYTIKGKIQIVARRIEDKVLITHLYHIERAE